MKKKLFNVYFAVCPRNCLDGTCEQFTANCTCSQWFYGDTCDKGKSLLTVLFYSISFIVP